MYFGSVFILPEILGLQLIWFSWKYYSSFPFFTNPCCCIVFAVLVSADDRSYFAEHVVSLLMPVLDLLARASCL